MRFYEDILNEIDPGSSHTYHKWDSENISEFWKVCVTNPIISSQFYPLSYWVDLTGWAKLIIRKLRANEPAIIADIGCGSGNLLTVLASHFPRSCLFGIDLSEQSLGAVKRRFVGNDRVDLKVGSVCRTNLPAESVDLVTCTEVLERPLC